MRVNNPCPKQAPFQRALLRSLKCACNSSNFYTSHSKGGVAFPQLSGAQIPQKMSFRGLLCVKLQLLCCKQPFLKARDVVQAWLHFPTSLLWASSTGRDCPLSSTRGLRGFWCHQGCSGSDKPCVHSVCARSSCKALPAGIKELSLLICSSCIYSYFKVVVQRK